MNSRRVRVWSIRVNTRRKKRAYTVRWEVAGREKGLNFVTRALADKYRSGPALLKVYAKCIDGQAASVNARIQQAVRGDP